MNAYVFSSLNLIFKNRNSAQKPVGSLFFCMKNWVSSKNIKAYFAHAVALVLTFIIFFAIVKSDTRRYIDYAYVC